MHCDAADRFYVRADGSVPCYCDIGENVTLVTARKVARPGFDYARDAYNGRPFRKLRERFAAGQPFLPICKSCAFFRPSREFVAQGRPDDWKHLSQLQIESSFLCPVDCPACVSKAIRTDPERSPLGQASYHMPLELFRRLIDDLRSEEIEVREIFFCGRGEPLLNPRFSEMLAHARSRYPSAILFAHTSGNLRYFPGLLELDFLVVSIDGAWQHTYEQYRRGGRLERALTLVRELVNAKRSLRHRLTPRNRRLLLARHPKLHSLPRVQWKYILFEHNDSPEEIREAQRLAVELGVDELQWTLSQTWNRSKRYQSMSQIQRDPLFRIFERSSRPWHRRRVCFDTLVNEEVDNIAHWERIGAQRGQQAS